MVATAGLAAEELDVYQFAHRPFPVHLQLIDLASGAPLAGERVILKVLLTFEGCVSEDSGCSEHFPDLIEVVRNEGIQEDGSAQIWVAVKDFSSNHQHQRFVIYVEAYLLRGASLLTTITNPFSSVRHKLAIFEANSSPFVWFKDEGAKDKCMKVLVKLVDADREVVTDRSVPLTVSLIYDSGHPVLPTSVLTVFRDGDESDCVGPTGVAMVKFRVNEVSRNHRRQLFHLLVAPDVRADASVGDVGPTTSVAFEVRSKRIVRERPGLASADIPDEAAEGASKRARFTDRTPSPSTLPPVPGEYHARAHPVRYPFAGSPRWPVARVAAWTTSAIAVLQRVNLLLLRDDYCPREVRQEMATMCQCLVVGYHETIAPSIQSIDRALDASQPQEGRPDPPR